jgi:hypothetical protein
VCQAILARIQTELGPEQVASARLLPTAAGAPEGNGKVTEEEEAPAKA